MNAREYNQSKALELTALWRLGLLPFDPNAEGFDTLIEGWQAYNGLPADGKCGPGTWAKLRESYAPPTWLRRLPRGKAEIVAVYGDIDRHEPALVRAKSRKVSLHRAIVDEFDAAFPLACQMSGYTPASVQTYNRRNKRGGDGPKDAWSTHAWGIAFDADPKLNPWGNKPSSPLVKYPAFAAVFRAIGWSCGVDWRTPDTMHFQACTGY